MLEKFTKHIQSNFPFLTKEKFYIAVSGGIDSMVLVDLCLKLKLDFEILHCNFKLRDDESDGDMEFVESYSNKNFVKYKTICFDTKDVAQTEKESIQITARNLRYRWFYEQLQENNVSFLATAHHLDDSLETFLINLSRGTGIEGLTGIPERNDKIIRPLLPFSRIEIEEYAKENSIQWREDSSNASNKYVRNKLRHDVIPILKELNPSFLNSFKNTLNHLQEVETLIQDASQMVYKDVAQEKGTTISFDIPLLLQYKNYTAYLFQWLNQYGFTAWNDIYELVYAQSGKQVFSETHILLKDRDQLLLSSKKHTLNDNFYLIESFERKVNIPLKLAFSRVVNIFETNSNCIFVDEDKIKFPLVVRKWHEGDYFYPSGMSGKKKLSKYFKDEKYSLLDKENQWLLCSENQIVWVIGKRADNRHIATNTTQQIIKIDLT
ncbi:tRNA lysidine(34) synthetase TilS [Flavobacterium channae]|uniref:tRNA lysidine(34) synthetase TilS n=1 Tax=Flavobacterium channae TaxID=2897181 RepID=UPI001E30D743|nr:tRNA lysidine(34) synthetase TilS [Flavobacterium channae]UGS22654.1 tRNA lysidine(34) synthetase TilS [Flavobacterium channae]